MLLVSTADKIQVQTDASAQVEVHGDFMELDAGAVTPGRINEANITTAVTVDVVDPPSTGTASRKVKLMTISNTHATVGVTVNVLHTDGTTVRRIFRARLEANEFAAYFEGAGWQVFDANGLPKSNLIGVDGNASIADQTANAADTYLAGSDFAVTNRLKATSTFRWFVTATKTGAGTATPIWSVRYGTAGTTADTARATHTGLAQTGVADTAIFLIEAIVRAIGASGVIQSNYGVVGHRLAATGFVNQAIDAAQATSAAFDTTPANSKLGISVNPGTLGVWTIKSVALKCENLVG